MRYARVSARLLVALRGYIRSISGVRKVFALRAEGRRRRVAFVDRLVVGLFARAFARLCCGGAGEGAVVAIATDSRPTGLAIAAAVRAVLLADGLRCRYLGVVPIPQLCAYCARNSDVCGAVCVTASHNPVGYNGLKFINVDGAVLTSEQFARFSADFDAFVADRRCVRGCYEALVAGRAAAMTIDRAAVRRSRLDYRMVVGAALPGGGAGLPSEDSPSVADVSSAPVLSVVVDFNGSARANSIDGELLGACGAKFVALGARVGVIRRQIEPEGRALRYLRRQIARARRAADGGLVPHSIIGYMPDNDGDRGNIVYYDTVDDCVRALEPQQLFALLADIRLVRCVTLRGVSDGNPDGDHDAAFGGNPDAAFDGNPDGNHDGNHDAAFDGRPATDGRPASVGAETPRHYVVANGPTSHRVDDIAARYGAHVQRAEVGEANVLRATRRLVEAGHRVALSGEGSNGGCIIAPARIRDPLIAVLHIVALLRGAAVSAPAGAAASGATAASAARASDSIPAGGAPVPSSLTDVVRALPYYRTTAVTDREASFPLAAPLAAGARLRYLLLLLEELAARRAFFASLAAAGFALYHYRADGERCCLRSSFADFTARAARRHRRLLEGDSALCAALDGGGGLKCAFYDGRRDFLASVWWRASGTERRVRLIVDVAPQYASVYRPLLRWHRRFLEGAIRSRTARGSLS